MESSWRKGYEDGFDFQPQGIWRLARTDTCGGPVEVQAFFCQYFFTRLSSAIAYAITMNGGDKYIVKRIGEEYVVGSPNVESATLKILKSNDTDPAAGVILVSDDSCVRIKINTQPLYGSARNLALTPDAYYNNIVIKAWGCATMTSGGKEGICGAQPLGRARAHDLHAYAAHAPPPPPPPSTSRSRARVHVPCIARLLGPDVRKLSTQWIDPESDENLFTTRLGGPQAYPLWPLLYSRYTPKPPRPTATPSLPPQSTEAGCAEPLAGPLRVLPGRWPLDTPAM